MCSACDGHLPLRKPSLSSGAFCCSSGAHTPAPRCRFLPAPVSTPAHCLVALTCLGASQPEHPPRNLPLCCQKWMRLHALRAVLCISAAARTSGRKGLVAAEDRLFLLSEGEVCAAGRGSRKGRGNRTLQRRVPTPKDFSSILLHENKITGKRGCGKYEVPLGKKKKKVTGVGRDGKKKTMGSPEDGSANCK